MTAKKWKEHILAQMELKGTDSKGFESVIDTLANLLEQRDKIFAQYKKEGSLPLVEYISNRGEKNRVTNPLLKEWNNMNRDALVYWRELGLTPAGLRKINEEALAKQNNMSALDKVLANLEK